MTDKKRSAEIKRKTREVDISGNLVVDGEGKTKLTTEFAFLNHMLDLFAFHGFFDLDLNVVSDLTHHGIEDIGIAIGNALSKAISPGLGIKRYGFAYVPMDETLARVSIDISGRPLVRIEESLSNVENPHKIKPLTGKEKFDFDELNHFFAGLTQHAKITLHIDYRYDGDTHHLCEAIFKALGIAFDRATMIDSRRKEITSTKGILDF
ncbi:MAG: imidazoleglycerol-phosphate dehydratase [Candidatus Omnitrophota bacterium]|nr:MAG: imidazoleglycerol-phosphate dehydratase [Candidatus Omnitrophota bacterium]